MNDNKFNTGVYLKCSVVILSLNLLDITDGGIILKKSTIVVAGTLLLSSLLLGACGNKQASTSNNSSSAAKTSKVTQQNQIVGSFKDNKDGAAITLNSDGTGQYVYADSDNPDTNDQLTWKKSGSNYTVNLKDSNVTSPLTAKLSSNQLTLSGDDNWNTETLTKVNGKLNLSQFLADAHKAKNGNSSQSSKANESSTDDKTVGVMAALLVDPDFFKDNVNDGSMYYGNNGGEIAKSCAGYSFVTSDGDPTSYIYYKQNGNSVTIKQIDPEGDESVAEAGFKTRTVSLDRLKTDYYNNSSKQSEVNGYVNKLKPYSEADK